jgi:hypothetical protein
VWRELNTAAFVNGVLAAFSHIHYAPSQTLYTLAGTRVHALAGTKLASREQAAAAEAAAPPLSLSRL